MAKFNAGTAVEAMEYDFTDFGGGTGVIPEPSDELLDEFLQQLASTMETLKASTGSLEDLDTTDPEALEAALASVKDEHIIKTMNAELTRLIAFICQDQPDATEIARLPFRVKQAFTGWLVGELNPSL